MDKGGWILPQCGCDIYGDAIKYCPLHKTAPDTYEALKGLMKGNIIEKGRIVESTVPTSIAIFAGERALAKGK